MVVIADSVPLMQQLAKMAGIPEGRISRMVLVLDVDDAPRLYTEGFLTTEEQLIQTELQVEEKAIIVNTTSMQNKEWRTKAAILKRD